MEQHRQERLRKLLSPQSIAVVGATERPGNGRNTIRCLQDLGFEGAIYPVNPKYETVLGLECYPSLLDLPQTPDSIVISVPAAAVNATLEQCARIGCHAATVYSSGFSEIGAEGAELQRQMAGIATRAGIEICGPNCLGHLDFVGKTGAYSGSVIPGSRAGALSAVSQSGSMAISMYQAFCKLGLRHVISYGNQAVTGMGDYLDYLAEDPHTKVITAFIEGVGDGAAFRAAADTCRRRGKRIVAMKIGRSEVSRRVALAHTAAMVGSDRVYSEVFAESGILEVRDIDEMIQTVTLLLKAPAIRGGGRKVAVTSISGGQCGVLGDIAEEIGLPLEPLSQQTVADVTKLVPGYVTVKNPLDVAMVGSRDYTEYRDVLRRLAEDEELGAIAVMQDAPLGVGAGTVAHYGNIVRAVLEVAAETTKPIIPFTNHSTPCDPRIVQGLLDAEMPLLQGTRESLLAIKHLLAGSDAPPTRTDGEDAAVAEMDWTPVGEALAASRRERESLGEKEGKEFLQLLGIPATRDILCTSEDDVLRAARAIPGRVALKIVSPDILHKTDVGGVALDLAGEEAVLAAWRTMLANVQAKAPDARIQGVAVQEMVADGVDLIIGMNKDPQFGPVLVFGLGGIYVELFKESELGLLPLSREKALEMIRRSRSFRLLGEVRGRPALDIQPLADILVKLGALMERYGDLLREIDLNPVRIGTAGVKVLDAMFVFEPEQ